MRIIQGQNRKYYNLDHIISYEIDDSEGCKNVFDIYITDCTGKIHEFCSIDFKEFKDDKIKSYIERKLFMDSIIKNIVDSEFKILYWNFLKETSWDSFKKLERI